MTVNCLTNCLTKTYHERLFTYMSNNNYFNFATQLSRQFFRRSKYVGNKWGLCQNS